MHVDEVLSIVRRLERAQRRSQRSTPAQTDAVASIRASAYVMIYNAVEAAMRGTLAGLRTHIQSEGVSYERATDFWRLDFIQTRFLERMQSGTNHGNVLVEMVPATTAPLTWPADKLGRLPFSGNFGQAAATSLRTDLGLAWRPPSGLGGGIDLDTIRTRRNELAHGLEPYDVVGSLTTSDDLFALNARTRNFMVSFVEAIERYQIAQGYLRS